MKGGDTITYYISIGIACAVLILLSSVIFAKKRKIRDTLIFISAIGFMLFAMIPSLLKRMAWTYIVALYSLILLAVSVIHTLISKKKTDKIENSYDDYLQRSASKTHYGALSPATEGSGWNSGETAVAGSPMDFDWGSQEDSQSGSEVQFYQADIGSSFQNDMIGEENFSTKRFEITGKDTNDDLRAKLREIALEVPMDVAQTAEQSADQERSADDMCDEIIHGQREALRNLMEEAGANCGKEAESIPLQKNVFGDRMEKAPEQRTVDVLTTPSLSDESLNEETSEDQISIEEPSTSALEAVSGFGEDLLAGESSQESSVSSSEEEEKKALLSVEETEAAEEPQTEKTFNEMGFTEKFKLYVESQNRQLPPRPSILEELALDAESKGEGSAPEESDEISLKDAVSKSMESSVEEDISQGDASSQDPQDAFAEKFKKYVQQHKKEVAPSPTTPKEFQTPVYAFGSSDRMNQEDVDRAVAAMVGASLEAHLPDRKMESVEVQVAEESVQLLSEAETVVDEIESDRVKLEYETNQTQEEMKAEEEEKPSVEVETTPEEIQTAVEIEERVLSQDNRMEISSVQERREASAVSAQEETTSSMSLFEDIEEAPRYGIAMGTELGAFLEQSDLDEAASAIFSTPFNVKEDEIAEESALSTESVEEISPELEMAELAEEIEESSIAESEQEVAVSETDFEELASEFEEIEEKPVAELEEAGEEPAAELEIEETVAVQEQSVTVETEESTAAEAEIKELAEELEELKEEAAIAEVELEESAAKLEEVEEEAAAELETEELEMAQVQPVAEEPAIEEAEIKEPAEEIEQESAVADIELEEPAAELEELEEEAAIAEIELEEAEEESAAELETEELETAQEQPVAEEPAIEEAEIKEPAEEIEQESAVADIELEEPAAELEEPVVVVETEEEKTEAFALDEDEIKHEILTQEEDAYVEIRNKRTISKVFSQAMYQKALENLEKGQVLEAVEKLSNLVVHSTDENIMISSYFKLKDLLGSSDEEMLEITRKLLLAHQDINGVYVDIIKKYMKDVI
ncbi:MAG: hypothetical protein Q4A78_05980 [Peptostreptococcaceae bacterium]|nr:hypothetical protein [Peptostreptococcaceae bacterium]